MDAGFHDSSLARLAAWEIETTTRPFPTLIFGTYFSFPKHVCFLSLSFHVANDLSLFVSWPLDWIWRVNPYSCECHASIGNWKLKISIHTVSANICNYNRICISSFICVRFTRDLEADRWEWPDPFCNQTASICFPYNTTTHPSGITHPVVSNYNHRHPSGIKKCHQRWSPQLAHHCIINMGNSDGMGRTYDTPLTVTLLEHPL